MVAYASANSADGARVDVAVSGFWGGRYEKSYLDVKVFNPFASNMSRENCYHKHEVDSNQTFSGGMAKQATTFYKRLASMVAGQTYSVTLCWLRCRISFSLLRLSYPCFSCHVLPCLSLQC